MRLRAQSACLDGAVTRGMEADNAGSAELAFFTEANSG
jgi:hypothetical protein